MAKAKPQDQALEAKQELPASLVLASPYGFIDENDQHRYWIAGTEVTNADEIALLIERGAPVQEPEEA